MNRTPVNLPMTLVDVYEDAGEAQIRITRAAVLDLARRGQISSDMGAEILGMRYEDFSVIATGEDTPLIDYG